MACRAPDHYYMAEQLQEITKCSPNQAEKLLTESNNDLMLAVEKFFATELGEVKQEGPRYVRIVKNSDHCDTDRKVTDVNANKVTAKLRYAVTAGSDIDDIITTRPRLRKRLSNISTENKFSFEDIDAEEDLMQDTVAISLAEAYPDLEKIDDKSSQLNQDLDKSSHLIQTPDKFSQLRQDLAVYLQEVSNADVEGMEGMVLEDCPQCSAPQIVGGRVFQCNVGCEGLYCSMCRVYHDPVTCVEWRGGMWRGGRIMDRDSYSVVNMMSDSLYKDEFQFVEQHIPYKCEGQLFDDNAEYQVVNILPKIMFDETDPLDREFRIAEGQFLRMNAKAKQNYEITSIDVVFNRSLDQKFAEKKEELSIQGFGDCLLLFHGTHQKNIEPILQNNFDLSIRTNGRAFGDGVYFSECPEVSLGYCLDQKSLILCKVLLGNNCKEVKKGDTRCWAIVVPDVNQILPRYVINFMGGKSA